MGREEVRGYEKKIQNSIKSRTSVPRICMYGSWKVNKNGAKILAELNAWNSGQKFWHEENIHGVPWGSSG